MKNTWHPLWAASLRLETLPMTLGQLLVQAAISDPGGIAVDSPSQFGVALLRASADMGWPPVCRAFVEQTVGQGSKRLPTGTLEQVGVPSTLYDEPWARLRRAGSTRPEA